MSVAKCLDCYVKLETVPCRHYPGGIAYWCPQCKLEYTQAMYESFVRQYTELYGEEFTLGYLFDEEHLKSDVITLGTTDKLEEMSDEIKELISDNGADDAMDDNDATSSYEQPIQEA